VVVFILQKVASNQTIKTAAEYAIETFYTSQEVKIIFYLKQDHVRGTFKNACM